MTYMHACMHIPLPIIISYKSFTSDPFTFYLISSNIFNL